VFNLGVNTLEDADSECASFASSRLSLSDRVLALNDRQDSLLLDRRRILVAVAVNSS